MSDPAPEELILHGDPSSSMQAILDFLAPSSNEPAAVTGGTTDGAVPAGGGQQPVAGEGAGAAAPAAAAPVAGDGGQPAVPPVAGEPAVAAGTDAPGGAAEPAGDSGGLPAATGLDPDLISTQLGSIPEAFDTRQREGLEQQEITKLVEERPQLFEVLKAHPRLLIGKSLPSPTGSGNETIRDAADAQSFQDAWRQVVTDELANRVESGLGDLRQVGETIHASVKFFQDNKDLIPGAKGFDKELADAFAEAAKDYVLKSNEKQIGWSVPVQPIVNALRSQIAARRATVVAQPPAAASPSPRQQQVAVQPRTETGQFDGPQAGILSQAGQSGAEGSDDASQLFAAFARQNGVTL